MNLLVCGGRDFQDWERMFRNLDAIHAATPIALLIQGGQKRKWRDDFCGADYFAEKWAEVHEINCLRVPAKWLQYDKPAGMIRNREMADFGPDAILAAPGGVGTAGMVGIGRKNNIPILDFKD